jgi:hypothetical protein
MEFNNLVAIKGKGCRIKKGKKEEDEKHMKVILVYCLLIVLQQLPSCYNYCLATTTILL